MKFRKEERVKEKQRKRNVLLEWKSGSEGTLFVCYKNKNKNKNDVWNSDRWWWQKRQTAS